MFLIRCFKLEKEYEEYMNKDSSPAQKLTEKDQTERKSRSETIDESREHIAALPSESSSNPHSLHKVGRANSVSAFKTTKSHHALGRSVSAGIYEDDVLLVNYHKFHRDGVPYVFDDRKTRKSLLICSYMSHHLVPVVVSNFNEITCLQSAWSIQYEEMEKGCRDWGPL